MKSLVLTILCMIFFSAYSLIKINPNDYVLQHSITKSLFTGLEGRLITQLVRNYDPYLKLDSNENTILCTNNNYHTFCYENIALTLYDGGAAKQVRLDYNGSIVKTISGEWSAYGSPRDIPGQTIKIIFTVSTLEFTYILIRDGSGSPSSLIDEQGRKYNLCKKS